MFKNFSNRSKWIASVLSICAGLWFFLGGYFSDVLPDDFSYHANILSYDNFYSEENKSYGGEILSKTFFDYSTKEKHKKV